jgi:lysophospholipase L1-like esterase
VAFRLAREDAMRTRREFLKVTALAAGALAVGATDAERHAAHAQPAAGDEAMPPWSIRIGQGQRRPDLHPTALFLTVPDVQGDYTIPYIQSSRDLQITADLPEASSETLRIVLTLEGATVAERTLTARRRLTRLRAPKPGEYTLHASVVDAAGDTMAEATYTRIGVGLVISAIGDSITEGYYGHAFHRGPRLSAADFPPEAVSRDGRNFPQYAPTSPANLPQFNCFQSWMTDLNNLLTEALKQPVFIANEGWGGYKTSDYLNLIRTDRNWQERMRLLEPNLWLIHLGVNDGRALCSAESVAENLEAIVRILCEDYDAQPAQILIARPSYDYGEGAAEILKSYCAAIDRLIARLGLRPGPDFYDAFSRDKQRYYGEDPVHPNVEGMQLMAKLCGQAIVRAIG